MRKWNYDVLALVEQELRPFKKNDYSKSQEFIKSNESFYTSKEFLDKYEERLKENL